MSDLKSVREQLSTMQDGNYYATVWCRPIPPLAESVVLPSRSRGHLTWKPLEVGEADTGVLKYPDSSECSLVRVYFFEQSPGLFAGWDGKIRDAFSMVLDNEGTRKKLATPVDRDLTNISKFNPLWDGPANYVSCWLFSIIVAAGNGDRRCKAMIKSAPEQPYQWTGWTIQHPVQASIAFIDYLMEPTTSGTPVNPLPKNPKKRGRKNKYDPKELEAVDKKYMVSEYHGSPIRFARQYGDVNKTMKMLEVIRQAKRKNKLSS